MRFAVPVFPGSSCDMDCIKAVKEILNHPADPVWHNDRNLDSYDAIILPGGFSYGDYLRAGALAQCSPVMEGVRKAVDQGKLVIGIGNGFQLLLEAGLLPGAIRVNDHLQFRCAMQGLKVENNTLPFTLDYHAQEEIVLPIAHGEGNYYCDDKTLHQLEESGRIVFRYIKGNPNGSVGDIAGIVNEQGNVLGMMPHPERAIREWMGSKDGVRLFTSMLHYWGEKHGAA
ncbi:phosphoribosylformylglycinamidine synthase subunit PurQ [Kroppenstedtia pulmonis]|uniref:Phosphoribosylformylglycinamidine synthase subunit PurQ n=1 Tax=Kroppenstedtia pulmonis TaxID=1380685 RepID=A0A7D3XQI8_9BACL|nr:phosphoribosylformylglycinamidine synthase subunit PurQ [Kroppenstedtia pulmonis]QKG83468.1 phosphoribosylformylglycinamidine synthase subunit PurQ [Kroppenstedtia pulmonis]